MLARVGAELWCAPVCTYRFLVCYNPQAVAEVWCVYCLDERYYLCVRLREPYRGFGPGQASKGKARMLNYDLDNAG